MILAKNSSFTWLVESVETMVCFRVRNKNKADEAAAHRQCARNADALKSDDGKCLIP